MIRDEDIKLVKSSVNMKQLAHAYGFRVNRSGYMICPFHNDKHPSLQVFEGYLNKDGYICRSCGAGGTIFNFVMWYEGVDFESAIKRIAQMFSISISENNEEIPPEEKNKYIFRMTMLDMEKKIGELNRSGMISLAEKIHLYEHLMENTQPYGKLFCFLGNRLPILKAEWEERFEILCHSKRK